MRAQANNQTLPIEFRSLSFSISTSRAIGDQDEKRPSPPSGGKKTKKGKSSVPENDFMKVDDHVVDVDTLAQRLRVSPEQGLSHDAAAKRLSEYGRNVLPSRRPNYLKKLAGYVFGGFCSILWVGVIIFFICWRPLGDPDPAPYNLGLAILVIIVIVLQASFCK